MNETEGKKKREWVKNAAIIFLTIMLLLTFFSNTIMNYSLPEVATQYVQSGSITAKVRGTGNVEATDPYNVIAKETRVISSVAVKQGDHVDKDQVIYYLEDAESDELKTAQDELEDLELAYMKGLFGNNVSAEVISKVANGNTDGFTALQTKVVEMQTSLDAAQARVKECTDNLNKLTLQSTISTNDAAVSTIPDELEKADATTDYTNAETAFNTQKANQLLELSNSITELTSQISDLKTLIASAESAGNSGGTITNTGTGTGSGESGSGSNDGAATTASTAYSTQKAVVDAKVTAIETLIAQGCGTKGWSATTDATEAQINAWYNSISWSTIGENQQKACEAAYGEYRVAVETLNELVKTVNNYDSYQTRLAQLEEQLTSLNNQKAEIEAITIASSQSAQDAQNRLQQAEKNILEITKANSQTSTAYANKIANAEAALKNAQAVYDLLKEEQTEMLSDINAELDLAKAAKDIEEKKEEIARLEEKSMGAAVTAPVAGIVSTLAHVAGESTKAEETIAVIQTDGKGFTMSISVTNEQAKKVQVGDTAELQNAWYYEDVAVVLSAIKPDPDDPAQKKQLVFDVSGTSIQNGQALNISLGQRSTDYELVVPNSAIREDSNGKFILTVESKSSPLGNRYIATRVDVEVLASDDNNTAIQAPLYGYEYVITTSTKPVEAGKQVRLNET